MLMNIIKRCWWIQFYTDEKNDDDSDDDDDDNDDEEDDDDVGDDNDNDADDDDDDDFMVSRVQSDSWQLFGKHKYFPKFALGHFYAEVDDDDDNDVVDHDERKAESFPLWFRWFFDTQIYFCSMLSG